MPATLQDSNFQKEILDHKGVAFVDFWAPWCGPCRIVGPIIEELAIDYADKVKVGKLNVDDNQKTARDFGVMSIPTMVIFKDGKEVDRIIGAMPKQVIADRLDKWLD
ncbi:MAG: thioredoxin [Firmicutes bacterium]|nr:thioredoxin [Bacillota bacterium]